MMTLSKAQLAGHALRAAESRQWLEERRNRYPYWARATPVGKPRPEVVDVEISTEAASAVLEPGWRTYAFRHRSDRDKFEHTYREHLKEDN
jgi:hypothetical protein